MTFGSDTAVLVLALALEAAFGDPVSRWHPVALFGRTVERMMGHAPAHGTVRSLAYGAAVVAGGVGAVVAASASVLRLLAAAHPIAAVLAGGTLLKASFSYRQLEGEALHVADQLSAGELEGARGALRALVSRDTATLPTNLAASAAVESLAENLSDSFVAPLFYFVLLGVPGALAYRAINTLDSMIGYHGRYEYLGRVAARLDDLANLAPARLTALLLVAGAALARRDWRGALRVAGRDHGRTASPNAGWPMAAMAGALGVELEKVGHYRLGCAWTQCSPTTIRAAVGVLRGAALLALLFAGAGAAVRELRRGG